MDLNERLGEDQRAAMKGGNALQVSVLRLLRTRIKESAVEKRRDLSDGEIYKIIISETKRREEAIDLFEKGGRGDLADREKQEIAILKTYLPEGLSEPEIKEYASEAVKEVDARSPRDLGRVMKVLMPKVTGRADGSLVNKIVKELLAEQEG